MTQRDPHFGLRFDTVAERYHAVRPRYSDAIWDTLFAVTGLQPGAQVLEIGAGTGIATAEMVRRGCHVTALEPGAAMAAIIDRELGDTGRVDVRVKRFDQLAWEGEPFDLVLGATSLHWIDRNLLHQRLSELVRPGGFAALLHYLHVAGGDMAFFEAAQRCYQVHAPSLVGFRLANPDDDIPAATLLDALPGFQACHRQRWLHDMVSNHDHYLALLSTYSTHLALRELDRKALLACIGDLMDAGFGGEIVKTYRFDLVIMHHPDDTIAGLSESTALR